MANLTIATIMAWAYQNFCQIYHILQTATTHKIFLPNVQQPMGMQHL